MDVLIFPNIGTSSCYIKSLVRSHRGPLVWEKWLDLLMETEPYGAPQLMSSQCTKGVRYSKPWHCSRQEGPQCLSNSPHCSPPGEIGWGEAGQQHSLLELGTWNSPAWCVWSQQTPSHRASAHHNGSQV